MTAAENKELVRRAFEGWSKGEGSAFDLLADDVVWTVTGASPIAGTYTSRQAFLEGAIQPIDARLSQPIRPTVESIVAEGDTVVVLWRGRAVAMDGQPYDNRYCWIMDMADGRVKEVVAFFESTLLTDLFARNSV